MRLLSDPGGWVGPGWKQLDSQVGAVLVRAEQLAMAKGEEEGGGRRNPERSLLLSVWSPQAPATVAAAPAPGRPAAPRPATLPWGWNPSSPFSPALAPTLSRANELLLSASPFVVGGHENSQKAVMGPLPASCRPLSRPVWGQGCFWRGGREGCGSLTCDTTPGWLFS